MISKRSKAEIGRIGRDWLQQHNRLERILHRPISFYFANQADRIAATIERAKITSAAEFSIYFDQDKETKALVKMLAGPEGLLFSPARIGAAKAWQARPRNAKAFRPRLPKFITAAIRDFMKELRSQSWWQNIAGTTNDRVGEIIEEQVDRGASIPNIAKAVKAELRNVTPARTISIARTETNGAMAAGQHISLKAIAEENDQFEVLSEWLGIDDKKLRPDHREATGQRINAGDEDARFTVGGEKCRFPGDPKLSAKQRINCRCTTIMVLPEEFR